mgnify:CR=1 FL=1
MIARAWLSYTCRPLTPDPTNMLLAAADSPEAPPHTAECNPCVNTQTHTHHDSLYKDSSLPNHLAVPRGEYHGCLVVTHAGTMTQSSNLHYLSKHLLPPPMGETQNKTTMVRHGPNKHTTLLHIRHKDTH